MKLMTTYKHDNYPILIEHGALDHSFDFSAYDYKFAFIDETVYSYQYRLLDAFLTTHQIEKVLIPSGEHIKQMSCFEKYCNYLLEQKITRNSCLFAIGGGACGDFTGFVAACVLRGIDFIQVPTTILAHDSAVGGKVGINTPYGKNLIGAFKRPKAVIYDLRLLSSLSKVEMLSGFSELIKHVMINPKLQITALMDDFKSFNDIEDLHQLEPWLSKGIQTKLDIVLKDEFEGNERKYLNFGHTFGHAIEVVNKIPHGIAVHYGIIYAMLLSDYPKEKLHQYLHWTTQLGYPNDNIQLFDFNMYLEKMKQDKKNKAHQINFVMMAHDETGSYQMSIRAIEENTLLHAFQEFKNIVGETVEYNES